MIFLILGQNNKKCTCNATTLDSQNDNCNTGQQKVRNTISMDKSFNNGNEIVTLMVFFVNVILIQKINYWKNYLIGIYGIKGKYFKYLSEVF